MHKSHTHDVEMWIHIHSQQCIAYDFGIESFENHHDRINDGANIFAEEEMIFAAEWVRRRIQKDAGDPWENNPENGSESEAKKVISSRMQSYNGLANTKYYTQWSSPEAQYSFFSYMAKWQMHGKTGIHYEHANWCE